MSETDYLKATIRELWPSDTGAIEGIEYLAARWTEREAIAHLDRVFTEGVREIVTRQLVQGMAACKTAAEVRVIAREIEAVGRPEWTI